MKIPAMHSFNLLRLSNANYIKKAAITGTVLATIAICISGLTLAVGCNIFITEQNRLLKAENADLHKEVKLAYHYQVLKIQHDTAQREAYIDILCRHDARGCAIVKTTWKTQGRKHK